MDHTCAYNLSARDVFISAIRARNATSSPQHFHLLNVHMLVFLNVTLCFATFVYATLRHALFVYATLRHCFAGLPVIASLLVTVSAAPSFNLPSMPGELGETAAGLIDGVIYVVGESVKDDDPGPTYAYKLASNTWKSKLPARELRGHHHGAEVIDGKFYIFGGLDFDGVQTALQIYDP